MFRFDVLFKKKVMLDCLVEIDWRTRRDHSRANLLCLCNETTIHQFSD